VGAHTGNVRAEIGRLWPLSPACGDILRSSAAPSSKSRTSAYPCRVWVPGRVSTTRSLCGACELPSIRDVCSEGDGPEVGTREDKSQASTV
jgi:hypothetical protein